MAATQIAVTPRAEGRGGVGGIWVAADQRGGRLAGTTAKLAGATVDGLMHTVWDRLAHARMTWPRCNSRGD